MRRQQIIFFLILMLVPTIAFAGVKMKIGDETEIDLGFRLQTQFISWDNRDGTTGDSEQLFNVRRARIRLGGKVTKWMNFFLQTEKGGGAGGAGRSDEGCEGRDRADGPRGGCPRQRGSAAARRSGWL